MTLTELAQNLRPIIEKGASLLDDADALKGVELFPAWKVGQSYTTGQRVRYDGVLYSVLQPHTSQDNWRPNETASLYAKVLIPDENEIPEWQQPDSTNAYKKGDKVRYKGKVYKSLIDNNVWSPDDYPAGWEIVE